MAMLMTNRQTPGILYLCVDLVIFYYSRDTFCVNTPTKIDDIDRNTIVARIFRMLSVVGGFNHASVKFALKSSLEHKTFSILICERFTFIP